MLGCLWCCTEGARGAWGCARSTLHCRECGAVCVARQERANMVGTDGRARWSTWLRRMGKVAGVATGGAALGTLGMAYYVAHALTAPQRPGAMDDYVLTPFETGADYEDVTFPSAGLATSAGGERALHGGWLPRPETKPVIAASPRYRGTKTDLICSS